LAARRRAGICAWLFWGFLAGRASGTSGYEASARYVEEQLKESSRDAEPAAALAPKLNGERPKKVAGRAKK